MVDYEEENEDLLSLDNHEFDQLGTLFQQPGFGYGESISLPPAEPDEAILNPGLRFLLGQQSDIPLVGQLPSDSTGPWVGQEQGVYAPQFQAFNHGGAPPELETPVQVEGGRYVQDASGQIYPPPLQNITYLTSHRGDTSEKTSNTSETGSSYLGRESSVFSGEEPDRIPTRTSASISGAGSSHRGRELHVCSTCGNRYRRPSDLKKHERKHIPEEERPIECEICGKRWLFKKDLDRHLFSHSGPQFECDTCFKRYTRRDNRDRHQAACPQNPNREKSRPRSISRLSSSSSAPPLRPRTSSDQSRVIDPQLGKPQGSVAIAAGMSYDNHMASASYSQPYTSYAGNSELTLRHDAMPMVREEHPATSPSSHTYAIPYLTPWMSCGTPYGYNQRQLLTPPQSTETTLTQPHVSYNTFVDTCDTESQSPPPSPSPAARQPSNSTKRQRFN